MPPYDRSLQVDDIRRATDLAQKAVSEYGLNTTVGPLNVGALAAGGDEYGAVLKDSGSAVARCCGRGRAGLLLGCYVCFRL